MGIVVQKYGGSSVATVEKLGAVADRVVATASQGNRVVVVVSAMGKTTDELLALGRQVSVDPPRRELDMLLSAGERIAMSLLAMAIHERGGDAISFTGSQCGLLTNDRHFNARIIEVRPFRVQDELEKGRIVIIAGYQGVSYKRDVTTLGRGGTDTTAVALAAALHADYCEILSDVDGVYDADPRVVPEATKMDGVSYDEVLEMARAGARVLCEQAVEWARHAGIKVYARATVGGAEGTVVRRDAAQERWGAVRAVAGRDDLLWASGPVSGLDPLLTALEARHAVAVDASDDGERCQVSIPTEGNPAAEALVGLFREHLGVEPQRRASVTLVGDGLGDRPGLAATLRQALVEGGIGPLSVDARGSRVRAFIPVAGCADAQRIAHDRFVRRAEAPAETGAP